MSAGISSSQVWFGKEQVFGVILAFISDSYLLTKKSLWLTEVLHVEPPKHAKKQSLTLFSSTGTSTLESSMFFFGPKL